MILGPDDAPELSRMGGKAFGLARLGKAFPIPAWFVVTPQAFDGEALRPEATVAIENALLALGPGPFAVRSSAVEEDQAASSFAGQLESYLDVAAADVPKYILKVRASAFAASVMDYRRLHGLEGAPATPAVLVQTMVRADCAGVAFSVDPMDETRSLIAVMAVRGLADRLVGGEVDGDTYRLTRDGTPFEVLPTGEAPILDAAGQCSVALLARRAEAWFGVPQDIEWAIAAGRLFLLQSRPITTLVPGEPTLWDNANIVESYSGVTSPLTFSFARHVYSQVYRAFCRLLGVPDAVITANGPVFDNMLGYVDGHVYYNLLNWYRALALLPGFRVNRRFMEQMMGVAAALPGSLADRLAPAGEGRGGLATFSAWLRLVWSVLCLLGQAIRLPRTIAEFQTRLDTALADPSPPLAARDLDALARHYRELEESLLDRWDAPLINDFLCMIAFGASRALLVRWCGAAAGGALHNDFMIGQGDIVSAEPARRIRRMAALVCGDADLVAALCAGERQALDRHPQLAAAMVDYLRVFGDRCTQELKLESLTLEDDATSLLQAVGHAAGHVGVPSAAAGEGADAAAELARLLAGKPLRYAVARRVVAWAKARVRDRENLRFQRTRVFGRVRRVFLEMGKRLSAAGLLAEPRDVFYLEVEETLGLVGGTATTGDPRALAELRRREGESYAAAEPPPNRFWTYGAVCADRRRQPATATVLEAGGERRQGLGCCRGTVRARVRLVHDPRREALRAGEILVARHTDPGWIALFSNAAGILVERGSLLSHSAIVAREMDIPAVVSLPGLMDWLNTGDLVEMDGSTGTVVRIHDPGNLS